MFWRKVTPSKIAKEISMIEVLLAASRARLDVALNIRKDRKMYLEYFYKVSIPSAMVGLPLTPLAMSNMFVNDTFITMKKVLKKLKKVISMLLQAKMIDPSTAQDLIESIERVHERMKIADSMPIDRGIEELKSCINEILSICSEVKSILASRVELEVEL